MLRCYSLGVIFLLSGLLFAQQPAQPRVYLPNLAEEDWRFLKDPSKRTDFWDPVKYIQMGDDGWSIGFGGELRYRVQGFRVKEGEDALEIRDSYLLQRYLLSVDLRKDERFRFFAELQSGIINGQLTSPRPTDRNLLDIHQGFAELKFRETTDGQLQFRIGRQELEIGSSRLIAAAQGLNVKRSFDGASTKYTRGSWTAALGGARLVKLNEGVFDDPPDPSQHFWGASLSRRSFPFERSTAALYYLGVDRDISHYVQGQGPERRHTLGIKVAGQKGAFDFSYDLIYQWGNFQSAGVRSWAVATETGYYSSGRGLGLPRLVFRTNIASGDRDPMDDSLESFNPLFPSSAYSGIVGLFGPTNLMDFNPGIQVPIRANLLIAAESPFYRRFSARDGVYSIELRPLIDGLGTAEKYVGANPGIIVSWQIFPHTNFSAAITRFFSGPFLRGTFVEKGFSFYSVAVDYRF